MGFVRRLTGSDAADAAVKAAEIQAGAGADAVQATQEATGRAQEFFQPFGDASQRGIEQSSFLANPEEQFDFLKSNPLFQLALDNANQQTLAKGAAGGRVNAGDTLQDLSNNVLLQASPLIDRQRQDIGNLLNLGTGVASNQANIETGQGATTGGLLTDIGAARAGGVVGAANAKTAGAQGLVKLIADGVGSALTAGAA